MKETVCHSREAFLSGRELYPQRLGTGGAKIPVPRSGVIQPAALATAAPNIHDLRAIDRSNVLLLHGMAAFLVRDAAGHSCSRVNLTPAVNGSGEACNSVARPNLPVHCLWRPRWGLFGASETRAAAVTATRGSAKPVGFPRDHRNPLSAYGQRVEPLVGDKLDYLRKAVS